MIRKTTNHLGHVIGHAAGRDNLTKFLPTRAIDRKFATAAPRMQICKHVVPGGGQLGRASWIPSPSVSWWPPRESAKLFPACDGVPVFVLGSLTFCLLLFLRLHQTKTKGGCMSRR